MSRNRNRLNTAAAEPADSPAPQVTQNEQLLSFARPTEFVDLPSKGLLYAEGHPLHGVETVEIRYMTAKEEDILTSKTLIRKGIVIDRLIQSVLIDDINVDDMLIGDKNAILLATRITGYGDRYDTEIGCPACSHRFEHSFSLSEPKVHHADDEIEDLGVTFENNLFFIELPLSKVRVGLKPLTSGDQKRMDQMTTKKVKLNLPETHLTDLLKEIVVVAAGSTDLGLISKFIEIMPAKDSRLVRDVYRKIIPNVDLTQEISCPSCAAESKMEVPFGADFFFPR